MRILLILFLLPITLKAQSEELLKKAEYFNVERTSPGTTHAIDYYKVVISEFKNEATNKRRILVEFYFDEGDPFPMDEWNLDVTYFSERNNYRQYTVREEKAKSLEQSFQRLSYHSLLLFYNKNIYVELSGEAMGEFFKTE